MFLPGVYLVTGSPVTWRTRAMGAVLWGGSGAVLSHGAAARVWGFDTFETAGVEITTSRRLRFNGVVVHRRALEKRDHTIHRGLPVTSVHRTLIDLGDLYPEERVEDALDGALRRRQTSARWLQTEIERVGTRGRKGASLLHGLLDVDDDRPSWLERRFIRLISTTNEMPPFVREHSVLEGRYFIDFAWPAIELGIEVHGERWHLKRLRWEKDLARHNDLTAAGWTILHFTWQQMRDAPETVLREILETYRRLAGLELDAPIRGLDV